jgi:hypothetical protein
MGLSIIFSGPAAFCCARALIVAIVATSLALASSYCLLMPKSRLLVSLSLLQSS